MKHAILYSALCITALLGCKKKDVETNCTPAVVVENDLALVNPNLKYFGFTLVDVFFDDPSDSEVKDNYIDEVHTFSNVADILVYDPAQDIAQKTIDMLALDMKPYLHLNEIFFEQTSTGGDMSGVIYSLRTDYQERWNTFLATNPFISSTDSMQCFYIGEEPTWNGISFNDLKLACDYTKSTAPNIPILIVEAYPAINQLQIPTSVDWYGFDHYFFKDPYTSPDFNNELALIRTKKSNPNQQLVLVMDAHFIPSVHGFYGIEKEDLTFIADQYFKLANENNDVVALLGYHWPSGFEFQETVGARGLNASTKAKHQQIGKTITGK